MRPPTSAQELGPLLLSTLYLISISKKYHISVEDLKEYNHLTSNKIITDQKLMIPDTEQTKPLYVVVAGSFNKRSNADKRVAFLKKKGIDAIVVKKIMNGNSFYRVQAGVFSKKSNAEKMKKKVKGIGIKDAFLLSEEASSYKRNHSRIFLQSAPSKIRAANQNRG